MTNKWNFLTTLSEGVTARQAHAGIPKGSFEREIGRDGFFGAVTQMYHRNPPTAATKVTGSSRPRAFNPTRVNVTASSPWDAVEMFSNACCRFRFWPTEGAMDHLVKNSDGDELLFVHNGEGDFYCEFGHLAFRDGDYIVIPRGCMWRLECKAKAEILLIESSGAPYSLPDRGMVGRHSPFDAGAFDPPRLDESFRAQQGPGRWSARLKRGNRFGTIDYDYNPLDALGWQGDLYPVRLNVRDIRPIISHRAHLPPSAHTTFLGNRFVVCTFAPRPMESDPEASKLAFFHSNDDYDEILFVHRGQLANRTSDIIQGSITFHPAGFVHGPHPDAMDTMFHAPSDFRNEYLVMIDTLDAMDVGELPQGVEIPNYDLSWRGASLWAPDVSGKDARKIPWPQESVES